MSRYGSDKPDTRFDVFLQDFTDIFKTAEAGVFREKSESGQTVRGFVAPKTSYSRKALDDNALFVKQLGGAGVAWLKLGGQGITRPLPVWTKFSNCSGRFPNGYPLRPMISC